jgi:hypothetical protein
MEPSASVEMELRGGRDGWRSARRWVLQRCATLNRRLYHKEYFPKREATLAILSLIAALTASARSTTDHLPITDAEKVADALRAAPTFITDGATIVDYPASKGGEFRVLRQGSSEWTCLPGPPPGSKHDDPGCFDKVFFQFVRDVLAGRPQHVERLGVAYMYTGHTVPGAAGGQFRVGAHIMLVSPHPEDLQGFTHYGWNGTYIIHLPAADQPGQWFLVIPIQADSERR